VTFEEARLDAHHDPADRRRLTSVNPAAANAARVPTWKLAQQNGLLVIG